MREQFLSASPIPHSLGTFLAEQESTAPGRENKRAGFGDLDSYDIERRNRNGNKRSGPEGPDLNILG